MEKMHKKAALAAALLLSVSLCEVKAQAPPPNDGEALATGIKTTTTAGNILPVYTAANKLYINFAEAGDVNAQIAIYNLAGQQLSSEVFGGNAVYSKDMAGMASGYVVVQVKNKEQVITKKIFVASNN